MIENAERRARFPVRHALMVGEFRRHLQRAFDNFVVFVVVAVTHLRVWNIRHEQQNFTQRKTNLIKFASQNFFRLAKFTAALHQFLGTSIIFRPPCSGHIFRNTVDLRSIGVSLNGDIAQSGIKSLGVVKFFENCRLGPTSHRRFNGIGL